ncbi:MAG: hypothetical protein LBP42_03070 [Treponema sp.]|jgi:hypothetical protein|nr:hypothetical protein [Treponema sp.]
MGSGASINWRDVKYEETFEQEIRGLRRRRESDPACTVRDLEGVLQHLYYMDGADWVGRGSVQDITMAATIAAYEHFIAEWKAAEQRV